MSSARESDELKFVGQRWHYAGAILVGTLLIVAPLTVRNAIVFHRFVPVSLGAGQTLLEGIGDYDTSGRFNIPKTDLGIMKMEAEERGRPDYYGTFFEPDGVERERWRLARGFAVIRSHPFWFSGVMLRRAGSMLRLERARLISTEPPVSHSLEEIDKLQPIWETAPAGFFVNCSPVSELARFSIAPDGQTLTLIGDDSKYGWQFTSARINVKGKTDYVYALPIKIEQGRMKLSVIDSKGRVYASTVVETVEGKSSENQPLNSVRLPFVTGGSDQIRLVFSNEASNPPNPVVKIGTIKLFELGPARFLWTRYPRFLVHAVQKLFVTAVILPLAVIGLVLLITWRRRQALIILLVVPLYFFCVQSMVHTEYRYVLAVDYFLFALVGVAVSWIAGLTARNLRSVLAR